MARKTLKDRRAAALADLAAAKKRVAELEAVEAERIGKIALKSGLADLELSEEQLAEEFAAIAAKFRSGATVKAGKSNSEANEG